MISFPVDRSVVLNITNRCNLGCRFCPKAEGKWTAHGFNLKLGHEPSANEVLLAVGDPGRYDEVIFSGLGEPTLRLYVALEIAHELRRKGLRTRLVTDGLANLVHGRDVTPDLENIIDSVSISLNAHDEATHSFHCPSELAGAYRAVLDFADRVRSFVPDVTLTVLDGLVGVDRRACEHIAENLGVAFEMRAPGVMI